MEIDFTQPKIMGVLNITPDSFSGDGLFSNQQSLVSYQQIVQKLIHDGSNIIDVGGESTGPGSKNVSVHDELARVKSVIDIISDKKLIDQALFSIDTYKAEVAEYALQNGFEMVNDVTALRGDEKMLDILLKYQPYVVLMYSKDSKPRITTNAVEYDDVIFTIKNFLLDRIKILLDVGFPKEKIIIDPGMGAFVSANPKYSFEIIKRLSELRELGYPILIGISRKSCLGGDLKDRDAPSVEWSLKAIQNGASIVRMHNVEMMKEGMTG